MHYQNFAASSGRSSPLFEGQNGTDGGGKRGPRGGLPSSQTPLESPSSCLGKNEVETSFVPKRRSTTISATHTVMLLGRKT